jgi:DNA-binding transcriptional LysR family regulator
MKRDELNDLAAFVVVADEMSFTRAAARLGLSPSALSHAMKALEERLGLQLLVRTTRKVSTTEAGERLLKTLRPAFEDINTALIDLGELRDRPAGSLRITLPRHAATFLLMPILPDFLTAHPEIRIEMTIDEGLTDIIESRYDAGIRFGEKVAKDMVGVRVNTFRLSPN